MADPTHYREILNENPELKKFVESKPALVEMLNEMQQIITWGYDNYSSEEYEEFLSWVKAFIKEHHVAEWEK